MQLTSKRNTLSLEGPFEMVSVAGTEVAVMRRGHGVPLMCLHAVGHGAGDFELLAGHLARHAETGGLAVELVAVDWPGHGRSPADATGAPASAARYGEILLALSAALFPGARPFVLGNSIGGAAAIVAAAKTPAAFGGIALSNPGGLAPVDATAQRFCRAMAGFFRRGAAGAAWYPALFRAYYRLVLPRAPARRAAISAASGETAAVLAEAWAGFAEPASDLRALLPGIAAPMFFAWAADDRIVSWGRSRAAVAACGAPVQMFRGGHAPFLEDDAAFAAALLATMAAWISAGASRPAAVGLAARRQKGAPPEGG